MSTANSILDWRRVHYGDSTVVDLHVHPGLKISLFDKVFTAPFHADGAFNPFSFESNFLNLRQGGVAALLSVIYAPERQIVTQEAPVLKALRYLRPQVWRKVFEGSYFDVANRMLDDLERAVAVKALLAAWNSAVADIAASPDSYRGTLVTKANLPQPLAESYAVSTYPTATEPTAEQVQMVLDWMKERGYLTTELTPDELLGWE